MVAHRGLRETDGPRQVASARFLVGAVRDQAEEPEAGGVGEGLERGRQRLRVPVRKGWRGQQRRAALVDLRQEPHELILTLIDMIDDISTDIDTTVRDGR
jgi:hypothetical protein